MERGLLWLPLLVIFIGLGWAGWNEFQKLEAYQQWAQAFERAKYDIYAVLGQRGAELSWGKPTRRGPINIETFSLQAVDQVVVWVDGAALGEDQLQAPPAQARQIALRFALVDDRTIDIPFTDVTLAIQWFQFLQQYRQTLSALDEAI